jgi:hypothetical protein
MWHPAAFPETIIFVCRLDLSEGKNPEFYSFDLASMTYNIPLKLKRE